MIAEQGEIRPFTNIVHAEVRHADHLLLLFERYGIDVPEDAWAAKSIEVPASRAEACTRAIETEIANIALYDTFLEFVEPADVRDVFTRLRDASRDRHLPAFERCAAGGGGGRGPGPGHGGARSEAGCGGHGHQERDGSCTEAGVDVQCTEADGDDESDSGDE